MIPVVNKTADRIAIGIANNIISSKPIDTKKICLVNESKSMLRM